MGDGNLRPAVTELRLTGFKTYRRTVLPLAPFTVLSGPSGTGKSNALDGLEVLARLALGHRLGEALEGGGQGPLTRPVRGGPAGCAPAGSRGFLLGCTVETRHGPVRLDLAVEVEPELRIVRERLTAPGRILLETLKPSAAPARGTLQAAWHSDVPGGQIRAPFADDRLLSAQLPLRIAGATRGERLASMAAEEVLVALRGCYPSEPVPQLMRAPGRTGDTMLRRHAENIAPVVDRIQRECRFRHGRLLRALQAVSPQPVRAIRVSKSAGGAIEVAFDEGESRLVPLAGAADGLLRFLAFAAVLLTGPGVLQMDPVEVPDADRLLTVLAEDIESGLAREQRAVLLGLAGEMCGMGHVRVLAASHEEDVARESGAVVVRCGRDPETGLSVLVADGPPVTGRPVGRPRGAGGLRLVEGLPGTRVDPLVR